MSPATAISTDVSARLRGVIRRALFGLVVAYATLIAVSYATGIWYVDARGDPVAVDFVAFWAAGKLVLQGEAVAAYDWAAHKAVAVSALGVGFDGHFSFQYPPTFLMATAALAPMAYLPALLCWVVLGLAGYAAAIRAIAGNWLPVMAALAWPATLWNAVVGQNGLLAAALLGGALALLDRRAAAAGLLLGLLTFKPQFGLLIPVALIAGGYWRAVAWAAATALGLAALSVLVLGWEAWAGFLQSAATVNTAILTDGGTGFAKLQSLYGWLRAMGVSSGLAWAAHAAFAALLAAVVLRAWRGRAPFDIRAAVLAAATLLASPYAFVYDFAVLAVPLAFLGRSGFTLGETLLVLVAGLLIAWGPAEMVPNALAAGLIVLGMALVRWRRGSGALAGN
ncbi:MAG: glycosyltransferase 87 family protein [Rhizobiaceae bacterium]|nr:glycosyltransferase 87 family protein [Rhizobiaceae bacterium]MCV0409071.1 glycosyltransferase 87 family protein [Rhizobiaceae bacterium]